MALAIKRQMHRSLPSEDQGSGKPGRVASASAGNLAGSLAGSLAGKI